MYCASIIEPWINFYFPQEEVPPRISQCCYFRCPTSIDLSSKQGRVPVPGTLDRVEVIGLVNWPIFFHHRPVSWQHNFKLSVFSFPNSLQILAPCTLASAFNTQLYRLPKSHSWCPSCQTQQTLFSPYVSWVFKSSWYSWQLPFPSTFVGFPSDASVSLLNLFSFAFFQFLYHCFLHRLLLC